METNNHIIDTTMPDSAQNPDLSATSATQTVNSDPQTATAEAQPSADAPASSPDQNFTIDIEPSPDGTIVNVNLPAFLTRHLHDTEKYELLQSALSKVFRAFYSSDEYFKPGSGLDINLAYKALEISLQKVFERAATSVLGPLPDKPIKVTGDIEESPFQPEAHEVYMNNPANYTDVEQLQKWIVTLQQMSTAQCHTINAQKRIEATQATIIEQMEKSLDVQEKLLASLEKETGLGRIATRNSGTLLAPIPKQQGTISLTLSLNSIGFCSEVDVLKRALIEYRNDRLKQAMTEIRNAQSDEAYNEYKDFEIVQQLLDELSDELAQAAEENSQVADYARNPAHYATWYNSVRSTMRQERSEFIETYSHDYEGEEEPATEVNTEPSAEPLNTATTLTQASTESLSASDGKQQD
ncbi:hypothetical protein [Spirosoma areae]